MSGRIVAAAMPTGGTSKPVFRPFPACAREFLVDFILLCNTSRQRRTLN
jgi:hypothetical protein